LVLLGSELLYLDSELLYAAPHGDETELKLLHQLRRTCSRRGGPLTVGRRLRRRDWQQPGPRRSLRPDHLHCFVAVGLPGQGGADTDQKHKGIAGKGAGYAPATRSPFTILYVGRRGVGHSGDGRGVGHSGTKSRSWY